MKFTPVYPRGLKKTSRVGTIMILFLLGTMACNRIPGTRELVHSIEGNFLSTLPLRFVENAGQTLPGVLFHAEGAGHTLLFETSRVLFYGKGRSTASSPGEQVVLAFHGSSESVAVHGIGKHQGVTNYYRGSDPAGWHTRIPTYGSVVYKGLYPGIDMVCAGDQGTFKNEFRVAAGVDPGMIQMSYQGTLNLKISGKGDLLISTGNGTLVDKAPVAYQEVGDQRKAVRIRYRLRQGMVSFRVGAYDPGLPLVIDPEFSYVTYYSGNDETIGQGIAVDREGYLLHSGYSKATDLPVANAFGETNAGAEDLFIIKMDTATGEYLYATYIGGDTSDIARDFAIDEEGNAYITGHTQSTNFPVTDGAYQTVHKGEEDVFLTKLGPDGSIVYSTLLGGSLWDFGYGLALNASHEAYLTGYAGSVDFPTLDAYQPTSAGSMDAFVSKISSGGDSLLYSTFLGGDNFDGGLGIALDKEGYIYVAGESWSTNFPMLNAEQEMHGGMNDAFITKLNPSGQALEYSTYLGGEGSDVIYDIAVDTGGNVYVCGGADSPDFPEMPFGEVKSTSVASIRDTRSVDFPGTEFGQARSSKSVAGIQDTKSEEVDAFVTYYNVVGHMTFCALFHRAGFNYFRTMVLMSGGIDPFLLVAGYLRTGMAVLSYAIRDYSEIIEDPGPVNLLEVEDTSHHYYPRAIDLIEPGLFTLDFSTSATFPTGENGTPDPNPEPSPMYDNAVVFSGGANLKVTITAPDSLQFGAQLVVYVKVENTSSKDARLTSMVISSKDPDAVEDQIMEEDCAVLGKVCMLGTIPAGSSVEKIVRLRMTDSPYINDGVDLIRIHAIAGGANTNKAEAEKVIDLFELDAHFGFELFTYGWKKSTHTEMIDLYVNDELVVDDLQDGVPWQQDIKIWGIRPRIDITDSEATDNLNPITTDTIDLCAPGTDHLISPRNHQLVLVEDPEGMMEIYHKRDAWLTASDPSKTDFFVIHGAGEIGDADIRMVDPDNQGTVLETLFDDLAPDSVTEYTSLVSGRVAFELSSGDNSMVYEMVEEDLTGLEGSVLTGVIIPGPGGEGASAKLVISGVEQSSGQFPRYAFGINGLSDFSLFPNPFGSETTITYFLERTMDLEVAIYCASGLKVKSLYNGYQSRGEHYIPWDGYDEHGQQLSPGTYLCVIQTGSTTVVRKLMKIY